jgi:murein L,D-transpeptidase YcbB/YkuD
MPKNRQAAIGAALGALLLATPAIGEERAAAEEPAIALPLPEPPGRVVIDVVTDVVIALPPDAAIETGAIASPASVSTDLPNLGLPPAEPAPQAVIGGRDLAGLAPAPEAPLVVTLPPPPPPPALVVVPPPPPPPSQADVAPAAGPIPAEVMKAALMRRRQRLSDLEAAAVLAFYEARGFAPLWVEHGGWNARAAALRTRLAAAGEDGLDPARYRSVSAFHAAGEPFFPALAAAEAQLTEALVLYAREATIGRVRPGVVHELMTPRLAPPTADAVLAALVEAADPGAALQGFNPPHPEYRALREALAEARANRPVAQPGEPIPEGPTLRLGARDPRVPLIRARLGLSPDGQPLYDREVSIKVAMLQRDSGLPVNGLFTPATRRALTGEGPSADEVEIIANMEFWRWLPRELGREHLLVNAPALEVVLRRDGAVAHRARVIIGKRETQTPFFSDVMDHIVVNPSWYVPPGILKREPKYLDPAYAAAHGYEITSKGGITGVRMPPGASNALGYVKFMFPNEHSVYLHDTPNRRLFNATNRTLSNGCVRVENPFQLAALLFASEGWSEERFKRLIGGGERRMNLPRKLPIHLAYFTMSVDAEGRLQRHPDVYGHAARLRQLLGLS